MHLHLLWVLTLWTLNLHGLPLSNTSIPVFPDLAFYKTAVAGQTNTSHPASLTETELFEDKVRLGLKFLSDNGAGPEYQLHGIMVQPENGEAHANRVSDFTKITVMLADQALETVKYAESTSEGWAGPLTRPFTGSQSHELLWNFNSLTVTLSEAFSVLRYTGYTGSWNMILIGWPETDPIYTRRRRQSVPGREPWFFSFDANREGRIVMVGGRTHRVALKEPREIRETGASNFTNRLLEVTR